ncbi:hypothetical protein CU254_23105 [Amycolatopsis sp. AA4]|uniref:heme-binding protein n=1 Tax=Actinomycetes TaxID=1760 RepID=UPI0001B545B4|nr:MULTISPECIES: heme-binding protein [Actinomycetes]ATY13007.1 hypothetical protein CU254_23105 [Amycolatopsis sp. AA4]EFL08877.1 predicted protein [Streptomyces sp. AA4]
MTVAGLADPAWIPHPSEAAFGFAVVDGGVDLLCSERQPGAPLFSGPLSPEKADTAATKGRSTADWPDMVDEDLVVPRGLAGRRAIGR